MTTRDATGHRIEDTAWDALVAAQTGQPDSYLREGEIISAQDDPAAMRISDMNYKGYRYVWDTVTGDRSEQPYWLLWQTMRKRRADGSQVFTLTDPRIPPDYGQDLTCPLSADAPPEQALTGMGFKLCNDGRGKHHIPHQDALLRHIKKAHPRAWEAMERERVSRERNEDREIQREAIATQKAFMEAMMQTAVEAKKK